MLFSFPILEGQYMENDFDYGYAVVMQLTIKGVFE
jgi:hypothetical protein